MDEKFDYFMEVRYDFEVPDCMEELIIPPRTHAVFPDIANAWKRLYSELLPASGYELANQPCIEHCWDQDIKSNISCGCQSLKNKL